MLPLNITPAKLGGGTGSRIPISSLQGWHTTVVLFPHGAGDRNSTRLLSLTRRLLKCLSYTGFVMVGDMRVARMSAVYQTAILYC